MVIVTPENKKEIFYNIINSLLAGALVFFGSLVNGFSWTGVYIAFLSSMIVALNKFQSYWNSESEEYTSSKIFSFL